MAEKRQSHIIALIVIALIVVGRPRRSAVYCSGTGLAADRGVHVQSVRHP